MARKWCWINLLCEKKILIFEKEIKTDSFFLLSRKNVGVCCVTDQVLQEWMTIMNLLLFVLIGIMSFNGAGYFA